MKPKPEAGFSDREKNLSGHKICAELLSCIYRKISAKKFCRQDRELKLYQKKARQLNLPLLRIFSLKEISKRYYLHLKLCSCQIKEHRFLSAWKKKPQTAGSPFGKAVIYLDNLFSAFEPPSPKGEGFLVPSSGQPRQLPRL